MGSLAPSWDSSRPGKAPKGFEDYKEPFTPRGLHKVSPFGAQDAQKSGDLDQAGGPPNLRRTSAPPMHGGLAVQRYLQRQSSGSSAPVSPRVSTPRSGTHKLTLKVGDEEMNGQPLGAKERWCARVESSRLNERPDEDDSEVWRHGSFKLSDASHSMHLPASPRAAAAELPATPPAGAAASPAAKPRVTVARVIPEEAMESMDSACL